MDSQESHSYSSRDSYPASYLAQQGVMGMPYGLFHYGAGYPMQMPMGASAQKPGVRRGKWTEEEVKLTDKIIETFNAGTLQLPEEMSGITLRSYLADKLGCDPMRITKKYTGASCLGKKVYHGNDSSVKVPPEVLLRVKQELYELEESFRSRLDQTNREKREHEADVEMLIKNRVVSTPAIDAMFMQGVAAAPRAGSVSRGGGSWGYPVGAVDGQIPPMHMYPGYMAAAAAAGVAANYANAQYLQQARNPYDFYPPNYAAAAASAAASQMHFSGGQLQGQGQQAQQQGGGAAWMYGMPGMYFSGGGAGGGGGRGSSDDDASTVPESALPSALGVGYMGGLGMGNMGGLLGPGPGPNSTPFNATSGSGGGRMSSKASKPSTKKTKQTSATTTTTATHKSQQQGQPPQLLPSTAPSVAVAMAMIAASKKRQLPISTSSSTSSTSSVVLAAAPATKKTAAAVSSSATSSSMSKGGGSSSVSLSLLPSSSPRPRPASEKMSSTSFSTSFATSSSASSGVTAGLIEDTTVTASASGDLRTLTLPGSVHSNSGCAGPASVSSDEGSAAASSSSSSSNSDTGSSSHNNHKHKQEQQQEEGDEHREGEEEEEQRQDKEHNCSIDHDDHSSAANSLIGFYAAQCNNNTCTDTRTISTGTHTDKLGGRAAVSVVDSIGEQPPMKIARND